jgi:alpha-tubulin suppressor-like RCC1 family protein
MLRMLAAAPAPVVVALVACWGRYNYGQLGPVAAITGQRMRASSLVAIALPGKAVDIAAGDHSSYALLDDGTVVAWGRADSGGWARAR